VFFSSESCVGISFIFFVSTAGLFIGQASAGVLIDKTWGIIDFFGSGWGWGWGGEWDEAGSTAFCGLARAKLNGKTGREIT
jgi:hypothetical protein